MADTTLLIEDQNYRTPKYILVAISTWVGSLSLGTVLGYSAPALPSLDDPGSHIVLNDSLKALFASLMALGAVLGSIVAGFFIETFGRKGTLIFTTLPFMFGWILIAYSGDFDSKATLFIGRILTGFCCGLISLTAPVYIAETSDPAKRGFFGSGFQLTVTLGVVIAYITGKYLNWADLALSMTIFPLLLLLLILWMPESPAWLLKKGRISEATEANLFLHGAEGSRRLAVDVSISTIQSDGLDPIGNSILHQFKLFSQVQYYKPLVISLALMFFQQFSGVNAMIFFMTNIFKESGFTYLNPADSTIIVGIIQVLATLVACFLSDRCGRKILLIVSSIGCCISLIPMTIFDFIEEGSADAHFNQTYGWIPIASLILFILFFSFGLGPIPWLIMGEILPFRIKSIASILVSSFNWFCAFLIITAFYQLKTVMNFSWIYLLFSVVCLLSSIFTAIMLPETKGKSFQEIESLFSPAIAT